MNIINIIIIMLFAIVLSNLLYNAYPKLPLPLLQIAFGVLITLSPIDTYFDLNPEIFMGMLIAPILFREAEEADLFALWNVWRPIIFLVFGIVFMTVFAIGFSVKLLEPSIPLAACFALGAILGPTDPVAVSTVSRRININKKVMNVLRGEWLVNDATGVISFNFAALALVTGSFSLLQAGSEFLLLCLGGILLGYVLDSVKNLIFILLKKQGIRNHAACMLFEILMPFVCYFLAEEIGFSGILAAVTAGSRQSLKLSSLSMFEAELSIVKKSIWEIISLAINSFVFILLGLHLPGIVSATLLNPHYSIPYAMGIALVVTIIMLLVRFCGTLFTSHHIVGNSLKKSIRNRLIITIAGVKGTVSLATAFSLPIFITDEAVFHHRDLLLLVTACSIIYSLLIATIFLPIIARPLIPKSKNDKYIMVLKELIKEVESLGGECANDVVLFHKRRIRSLEYEDFQVKDRMIYRKMRRDFIKEESKIMKSKLHDGSISSSDYYTYANMLSYIDMMQVSSRVLYRLHSLKIKLRHSKINSKNEEVNPSHINDIYWDNTGSVIETIKEKYSNSSEAALSRVVHERIDLGERGIAKSSGHDLETVHLHVKYDKEIRQSFDIERSILTRFIDEELLSGDDADMIRREINMMESYTLEDLHNEVTLKVLLQRAKREHKK